MDSYKNVMLNFISDINQVPEDGSLDFMDDLKYYKYDFIGKIDNENRNYILNMLHVPDFTKADKISFLEAYSRDEDSKVTLEKKEYTLREEQKESLKLYYNKRKDKAKQDVKTTLFELHLLRSYPYYFSKVYDITDEMVLLDSIKLLDTGYKIGQSMVLESNLHKKDTLSNINMLYNADRLWKNGIHINALTYIVNNLNIEDDIMNKIHYLNPTEEIINTNVNNNYNFSQHLRNALTHGWYFINENGNLEIYDNHNRKQDDYNFYYHASVDFKKLEKEVNKIVDNKTLSKGIQKRR